MLLVLNNLLAYVGEIKVYNVVILYGRTHNNSPECDKWKSALRSIDIDLK